MSLRSLRGALLAVASLLAMALVIPAARAQDGIAIVSLDGRGWGHGVGLSQWGAKYMADSGATAADILGTFYPGTELASVGDPEVRVAVYSAPDGTTTFSFPNGGDVRSAPDGDQAPGFPVYVAPGGTVQVTYDGSTYRVAHVVTAQGATTPARWSASTAATADGTDSCIPLFGPCDPGNPTCGLGCPTTTTPPSTTEPPATQPPATEPGTGDTTPGDGGSSDTTTVATTNAPVWAVPADGGAVTVLERARSYRGMLEATAGGGPLRVVNQLDVDTYLKGMAEVPGNWPLEAVSAQAIVARTYALRAMAASGELCDYDLCQVYVGTDGESAGQSTAVDNTSGIGVAYAGRLASTVYSADAGGISATTLEGFGTPDGTYPYLTTVRYDTPDPLPWHLDVSLRDVAARVGYRGTLDQVSIGETGPSGRALNVTLDGSSGPVVVNGREFAADLGLRSTLFTPTVGVSSTAPAAPPAPTPIQVLPDDASALHNASASNAPATNRVRDAEAASGSGREQSAAPLRQRPSPVELSDNVVTWIALAALGSVTLITMARGRTPALLPNVPLPAPPRPSPTEVGVSDGEVEAAAPPVAMQRTRLRVRARR